MQDLYYQNEQSDCNAGLETHKSLLGKIKERVFWGKASKAVPNNTDDSIHSERSGPMTEALAEKTVNTDDLATNPGEEGGSRVREEDDRMHELDSNETGIEPGAGVPEPSVQKTGAPEGESLPAGKDSPSAKGDEGNPAGGAAPERKCARPMRPVSRCIKNYNEQDDLTKEKIREVIEAGNIFQRLVEIEQTIGVNLPELFEGIADPRDQNRVYYRMCEMMAFDIFGECMGLHSGRQTDEFMNNSTVIENIGFWCGYEGLERIPDRATRENLYSRLNADEFRPIMFNVIHRLIESNRYLGNRFTIEENGRMTLAYPLVFDATQIAYFEERHCQFCYQQKIKEDKEGNPVYGYSHKILAAKIALSDRLFLTVDWEPINGNEISKQDSETKAAATLLKRVREGFSRTAFILQGDSLYATRPMLGLATHLGINFLVTVKEGSQPDICAEARLTIERGEASQKIWRCGEEEGMIYWVNDIGERAGKDFDCTVNFLMLSIEKEVKADGTVKTVRATKHPNGWKHYTGKELSDNPDNVIPVKGKDISQEEKKDADKISQAEDEAVKKAMEGVNEAEIEGTFAGARIKGHGCEVYVREKEEEDGSTTIVVKLVFSWLTGFEITEKNAVASVKRGRKRWAIETSFNNQKNVFFDIENPKGYDPNSMKVHFWLTQFADLILQMYFAYDKTANICGLSYTAMMRLIYISCRTQRLSDWYVGLGKPVRLYEQKRRAS